MFHRKEPYTGKEAIAVAMEVMNKGMRPPVAESVPIEMQSVSTWKVPTIREIKRIFRSHTGMLGSSA
jgi:hypothetical protein